jgi:hypothetical protein
VIAHWKLKAPECHGTSEHLTASNLPALLGRSARKSDTKDNGEGGHIIYEVDPPICSLIFKATVVVS